MDEFHMDATNALVALTEKSLPPQPLAMQSPPPVRLPAQSGATVPRLPSDPRPGASDESSAAHALAMGEGEFLRDLSCGIYLHQIVEPTLGRHMSSVATQYYRDLVFREFGQPRDPAERMLIDQLLMLHHQVYAMHYRISTAVTADDVERYNSSLCRLTGELRRLALALRSYGASRQPESVTFVQQQNLAHGDQHISLTPDRPTEPPALPEKYMYVQLEHVPKELTNELRPKEDCDEPGRKPARRGKTEASAKRGRARTATTKRAEAQAVASLDGPADAGGQAAVDHQRQEPPEGADVCA